MVFYTGSRATGAANHPTQPGETVSEQRASDLTSTEGNADTAMVFRMRLLLAIAALLTLFLVPEEMGMVTGLTWLVLLAYTVHSAVLFCAAQWSPQAFWHGKTVYWLDVGWSSLMLYSSGGNNSFFFPFFFFAILAASFHWGFDEGARIALASAVLMCSSVLLAPNQLDHSRLLLRATFLLGLGYMIAHWGGRTVEQKRRLALLRDVSALSNPRFGVEQTIASVLEKIRLFYRADSCLLLMRAPGEAADGDGWLLRTVRAPGSDPAPAAAYVSARIGTAAAAPLLAFAPLHSVIHSQLPTLAWQAGRGPRLHWQGATRALEAGQGGQWCALDAALGEGLADLLEAPCFISAPLPLRRGEGRLYVLARRPGFVKADALFLGHIAAQVFPVIENIELLDRLASDAALRERQKIARDLHDSTIQPYIGLRHAISAMRQAAAPDNALTGDMDRLIDMTSQVIVDMRDFAKSVRQGPRQDEPELLVALRRQAHQVQQFYDIDIAVGSDGALDINDRLAAEVFQIAIEGMSNIRKHSAARHGAIHLSRSAAALRICIENEGSADGDAGVPRRAFMPNSIAERAAALGGTVQVDVTTLGHTAVHVAIPV